MGKVAAVTGGIGDIVYSIPVARRLGVDTYYIKENFYADGSSMYTAMKPLLESQGFKVLPTSGAYPQNVFEPGLMFDYNFDAWRSRPGRDRVHIIKNMALHFQCYNADVTRPWLRNIPEVYAHSNLIFLTWRWRENSKVNWRDVLIKYGLTWQNTHFIGLPEDYELFKKTVGDTGIGHFTTEDMFEMATIINGSDRLFCNQGVALTIAQGLNKKYWLERKPNKTNTLLFTSNEHLL